MRSFYLGHKKHRSLSGSSWSDMLSMPRNDHFHRNLESERGYICIVYLSINHERRFQSSSKAFSIEKVFRYPVKHVSVACPAGKYVNCSKCGKLYAKDQFSKVKYGFLQRVALGKNTANIWIHQVTRQC